MRSSPSRLKPVTFRLMCAGTAHHGGLKAFSHPGFQGLNRLWHEPFLVHNRYMLPKLRATFYAQPGSEPPSQPVRAWLKRLPDEERKEIGADIQSVQFGWPLGLPLVRHLRGDLWEVRSSLNNRIARVIFAVEGNTMYLLHGFIKTTQTTPPPDLALAEKRWKQIKP